MTQSFLHTKAWEKVQNSVGHVTLWKNDQLFIQTNVLKSSYFVCSRCIVENDFLPEFSTQPYFIRCEPLDSTAYKNLQTVAQEQHYSLIPTWALQPRQTSIVHIGMNDEELLKRMHSKHRYNIRLAERQGVIVEIYSKDTINQLDRFWNLLTATAARQGFRTHAKEYYRAILENMEREEMVHLLFARYQDKDAAALLLVTHEDTATYLHGATDTTIKGSMAPYALHWQAMEFARSHGCTFYDLWGTHAEQTTDGWQPISGHPSAGVTRLKLGFGGEVVEYPGTFDLVLQPFWYKVYTGLRKLRGSKRAFV